MKTSILLAYLLLAGCASSRALLVGAELIKNDGHVVRIAGSPSFSSTSPALLYFCPIVSTALDLSNCIDVIAPENIVVTLRNSGASCAEAKGSFTAFSPDRVGMGNFRSRIGYLEATTIEPCHKR
jgi:hypothetical protein